MLAQNIDMKDRPARGTIRVAGLKAGAEVQVLDENRTIRAEEGGFSDDFEPLAEHLYRLRAAKAE